MTFETEAVIAQEPWMTWCRLRCRPRANLSTSRCRLVSQGLAPPPGQVFCRPGPLSQSQPAMWLKIASGLAVLAGSWIALYVLRPGSWRFVALYLLGGLAQTFLLLNIAHDSNHNAISSARSSTRPSTTSSIFAESAPTCGASSTIEATIPASIFRVKTTPFQGAASSGSRPMNPVTAAPVPAHLRAVVLRAVLSGLRVLQRLPVLLLSNPRLPEAQQASSARIHHPLCRQGLLSHATCWFCPCWF